MTPVSIEALDYFCALLAEYHDLLMLLCCLFIVFKGLAAFSESERVSHKGQNPKKCDTFKE